MLKEAISIIKKLPKNEKKITLATKITIARAFLIPFIGFNIVAQNWNFAFWLFLIASLTDMLDGGLARFRNEQTILGACLDPIVDKLLILTVYFTLILIPMPLFIPKWFFILILAKEFFLILGVLYIFYKKGFFKVQPSIFGKLAMVIQVIFISWLFACYLFNWIPTKTYFLMLSIVLISVSLAFFHYIYFGIKCFFKVNYE